MIRIVIFSLWLPVLVIVVTAARFGLDDFNRSAEWSSFIKLFAWAWPAAIPLTLAVGLLHRRSRILAYGCALVLGIASIFTAIFGGLFGPAGVIGFTVFASLPAWLILGSLTFSQRARA